MDMRSQDHSLVLFTGSVIGAVILSVFSIVGISNSFINSLSGKMARRGGSFCFGKSSFW